MLHYFTCRLESASFLKTSLQISNIFFIEPSNLTHSVQNIFPEEKSVCLLFN